MFTVVDVYYIYITYTTYISVDYGGLVRAKLQNAKPRVKIHGAWAFGFVVNIFAMDDPSKHNSSCIIEAISRTVQEAQNTIGNVLFGSRILLKVYLTKQHCKRGKI